MEKVQNEEKKSRLVEAFTKDYKYEGLVLLVLAVIALILGVLIKNEVLSIEGAFLIGDGNGPQIFAWILISLGIVSILFAIWPYYKPSIYEIKRVSWPNKKTMLEQCTDVLIYSVVLALFFFGADAFFEFILGLIK